MSVLSCESYFKTVLLPRLFLANLPGVNLQNALEPVAAVSEAQRWQSATISHCIGKKIPKANQNQLQFPIASANLSLKFYQNQLKLPIALANFS